MDLAQKIASLRRNEGMTQEELAAYAGVSRQAVQKWESGASKPDIDNLVVIAQRFQITINDLLLNEGTTQTAEELRFSKRFLPNYANLHNWEMYSANIMIEYEQLDDEGFNVYKYKKLAAEIAALPAGKVREDMADLLAGLMFDESIRPDYEYYEPSKLQEIKAARKSPPLIGSPDLSAEAFAGKIRGAWLGRIIGCLLGKPVEGITKSDLDFVLKATGNYPMHRYILKSELSDEICEKSNFNLKDRSYADTIEHAPTDDDTNYTAMAAYKLIEKYGRDFEPLDVAKCWLDNQPKEAYCTAERIAFINFVNGYEPPVSAIYKNPFREWIGAQIRGDYFGYINPGNPELAAEMAWRDASISHIKNGIYGEMFVAAMLAHAAVCEDVMQVILRGLGEIPDNSRLHSEIMKLIERFKKGLTAEECRNWICERYDERKSHHWCHSIANALIVVMALLYGENDFGKTICLAVGAAFDTDCNGATAGSVIGMMFGDRVIPDKWSSVINGKLETSIFGVGTVTIDELCGITLRHAILPKNKLK